MNVRRNINESKQSWSMNYSEAVAWRSPALQGKLSAQLTPEEKHLIMVRMVRITLLFRPVQLLTFSWHLSTNLLRWNHISSPSFFPVDALKQLGTLAMKDPYSMCFVCGLRWAEMEEIQINGSLCYRRSNLFSCRTIPRFTLCLLRAGLTHGCINNIITSAPGWAECCIITVHTLVKPWFAFLPFAQRV